MRVGLTTAAGDLKYGTTVTGRASVAGEIAAGDEAPNLSTKGTGAATSRAGGVTSTDTSKGGGSGVSPRAMHTVKRTAATSKIIANELSFMVSRLGAMG